MIDLTQQPIGSEWITKGGLRAKLLARGEDATVMVRICDQHVIEGLNYPANARWMFTYQGSFIWEQGPHNSMSTAERDVLKIVGPWVEPTQPVVDENRPVELAELPQTMINPDLEIPKKKKKGVLARFLGA